MTESSGGERADQQITNQLSTLVPSFDPSKDDMQTYQQKVEIVLGAWPKSRITELTTRLILNTSGSAFSTLQLHHAELMANEEKSVMRLIELLGGQWGRIGLEQQYQDIENALYTRPRKPMNLTIPFWRGLMFSGPRHWQGSFPLLIYKLL